MHPFKRLKTTRKASSTEETVTHAVCSNLLTRARVRCKWPLRPLLLLVVERRKREREGQSISSSLGRHHFKEGAGYGCSAGIAVINFWKALMEQFFDSASGRNSGMTNWDYHWWLPWSTAVVYIILRLVVPSVVIGSSDVFFSVCYHKKTSTVPRLGSSWNEEVNIWEEFVCCVTC